MRDENPQELLPQLSVLLRRVAITRFPRHHVAALTGERWLAFLDSTLGDGSPFQSGSGRALHDGPYARRAEVDVEALLALCERWIRNLPARGAR